MNKANKGTLEESRWVLLTRPDVEAAGRLMSLLALETPGDTPAIATRRERVQRARAELKLRDQRLKVMGKELAAEAPFAILLALYATEERVAELTITEVIKLAFITHTTAIRWLERLERKAWIERRADPNDTRKVLLRLSPAGRVVLDELFALA